MQGSRGNQRDRHGRGFRRPLLGGKLTTGSAKADAFAEAVNVLSFFLTTEYPLDFANLTCKIEAAPEVADYEVPRWDADRDKCVITLYRTPIERLGHKERIDEGHIRSHIQEAFFEAAGYIAGTDPWKYFEHWSSGETRGDENP